jgi:transposase InsO family protein
MLSLLKFHFPIIFSLFRSRKSITIENILLKKQLEIKTRKKHDIRKQLTHSDRVIMVILNMVGNIKDKVTIIKPETVLKWQRILIKRFWTYPHPKLPGRPTVPANIKNLILSIKNDNLYWGAKRIQGELIKLGTYLAIKTIRNIVSDFRRNEKVKKGLSWSKFLKMQAKSIYAMDFFTIDTITNCRYYVHFIISHASREIVQYAVTKYPVTEFVRQQIITFEEYVSRIVYIIHDHGSQFFINYSQYDIVGIKTAIQSPNMNAIAERFVKSIRTEALDHFLLFNEKQIRNILSEYINYYNSKRPHQGIAQKIPAGDGNSSKGSIKKLQILGGLHNHYYRKAA